LDPLLISILGLAAFFLLMTQGVPIAFSFAIVGCVGVVLLKGAGPGLGLVGSMPYIWASAGALLPVPLFILMGQFVYHSGISAELYAAAHKWTGRFPGGLALATTLASTGFAACSGVSMAGAATMASVAYPEMKAYNYDPKLSTGCITAGGSLSCLIPPSAAFIIYGALTETSVGKLFIAGILPGLLLSFLYLSVIFFMAKRNPKLAPPGPAYSWREMLASLKGTIAVLVLFLLVIGGLFAGVFTPSEAGSMGAFGAFVICLVRRRMTLANLVAAVRDSIRTTCFILTITIGAMIFSSFLGVGGFSGMFRSWITGLPVSPDIVLICILLIYIPLGMVMDGLAMLLLTIPIVFPVVLAFGFDPVWFGIIMTLIVEMALITPPVGLNSYVVAGVTGVPLESVFRGVFPFFLMMVACLILLYAFPQIVLFLPGIMK
jgi:tripartite ATP-independent transporter DctM subunit